MEIFGIPIFFIILGLIWVLADNAEKQQKEKEETARKWGAIRIGIGKDAVIRRLGKPHQVWQAGEAEIWGYGPSDSDGQIKFLSGKIIDYKKPD